MNAGFIHQVIFNNAVEAGLQGIAGDSGRVRELVSNTHIILINPRKLTAPFSIQGLLSHFSCFKIQTPLVQHWQIAAISSLWFYIVTNAVAL